MIQDETFCGAEVKLGWKSGRAEPNCLSSGNTATISGALALNSSLEHQAGRKGGRGSSIIRSIWRVFDCCSAYWKDCITVGNISRCRSQRVAGPGVAVTDSCLKWCKKSSSAGVRMKELLTGFSCLQTLICSQSPERKYLARGCSSGRVRKASRVGYPCCFTAPTTA